MRFAVVFSAVAVLLSNGVSAWTIALTEEIRTTESPTPPPTTAPTTTPAPTYPPIANPYMEIELQGDMSASSTMSMSCTNDYSKQFQQTLKSELQRAHQDMLANPNFCAGTTSAVMSTSYVNMVAAGQQVYLSYGVEIVSEGANTLEAMSACAWQLGAYLSDFNNWRQPIWTDIYNCPRLTWNSNQFTQTSTAWVC